MSWVWLVILLLAFVLAQSIGGRAVRNWLYPELEHFRKGRDRRLAFRDAHRQIGSHPKWLAVGFLYVVIGGVIGWAESTLNNPVVTVLLYMVLGVLLALTIRPIVRTARARLRQMLLVKGMCPICGYDLTGNVAGRCSECGTVIEWQP